MFMFTVTWRGGGYSVQQIGVGGLVVSVYIYSNFAGVGGRGL